MYYTTRIYLTRSSSHFSSCFTWLARILVLLSEWIVSYWFQSPPVHLQPLLMQGSFHEFHFSQQCHQQYRCWVDRVDSRYYPKSTNRGSSNGMCQSSIDIILQCSWDLAERSRENWKLENSCKQMPLWTWENWKWPGLAWPDSRFLIVLWFLLFLQARSGLFLLSTMRRWVALRHYCSCYFLFFKHDTWY